MHIVLSLLVGVYILLVAQNVSPDRSSTRRCGCLAWCGPGLVRLYVSVMGAMALSLLRA